MDVDFTPEDVAFREEVRSFIEENYPKNLGALERSDMSKEDLLAWHKVLHTRGWVAPSWPVEFGGTDWTVTQRYIFNEESARYGTVPPMPFGVQMLGPVIYTFGNQEQKDWVLPGILSGKDWWCQGYSEPGAGSDLAALKTKAVLEGDEYVVNGHKIWTTLAQHADWMFCLVRTTTSDKRQDGISFLLIDMKTPGITVRPIITIDGGHEVNEVFLEDVRVPAKNLVGEQDKGWTIAKFLLGNERSGIAGVARSKKAIDRLREIARGELENGDPLLSSADFSRKIAELEVDLTALEYTELRTLAAESQGQGPGPESSILKIKGTEIQQRITELTMEAVGNYAAPWVPQLDVGDNYLAIGPDQSHGVSQTYFNTRKTSIYGGSNEIQRNIIAKMVLGL
ncbi:MAG: acyl-CoA dehydrogenase family protein [PS1 clade bacterium]|nr:acyl-CoA dehydrogenase family protein [PS1 clade bacterium]CAI8424592.1 MAG: Putative acyl-CoA dehydrogenase FadE17 [Rhodobiaceae bacterium UBA7378]|tara:strand:- start:50 stop:1237 length:1188 start_codon:yes stop_codon:yes gene_type:complete